MATNNAGRESITVRPPGNSEDTQHKSVSVEEDGKQEKDSSTSSLDTQLLLAKHGTRDTCIEALKLENERLKKQLMHAETLGRIIADCKQNNLILSKENGDLHERLHQFVRMQMNSQSRSSTSQLSMIDDYNAVSTKAEKPEEEQIDNQHKPSIEATVSGHEVTLTKETCVSVASCQAPVEDSSPLPSGVGEVEEIFAAMMSGDDIAEDQVNDVTKVVGSTSSVTSQFTKLATIFTRLAQKVMLTQKKARATQAFCDALLRENHKLKMEFNAASKETETLKQTLQGKSNNLNGHNSGSSSTHMGQSECLSSDETLAKECPDAPSDEVFANMSNWVAKEFVVKLQNRVKKLEMQRNEILTVNKQWHTQYNKLKDEAEAKSAALQAEMENWKSQISDKQEEQAKRRKDINALLLEAKKEIEILQRQKGELARSYAHEHSMVKTLNEKADKHKADMSCIKAENQRLNQALEAAYSIRQNRRVTTLDPLFDDQPGFRSVCSNASAGGEPSPPDTEAADHAEDLNTQIEVLQEQVKIYREDFETERRDREKSQTEKQKLNEEMTRMRDEMRALNQQVRVNEHDFRQERREKQRLQLQLTRVGCVICLFAASGDFTFIMRKIQAQVATGGSRAVEDYYDCYDNEPLDDAYGDRRVSATRDEHRCADSGRQAAVQTATTAVNSTRRYAGRTRTTVPPPYTNDSPRQRRRPVATSARRIRGGYLEPRGYQQDLDVVYPPNQY